MRIRSGIASLVSISLADSSTSVRKKVLKSCGVGTAVAVTMLLF